MFGVVGNEREVILNGRCGNQSVKKLYAMRQAVRLKQRQRFFGNRFGKWEFCNIS